MMSWEHWYLYCVTASIDAKKNSQNSGKKKGYQGCAAWFGKPVLDPTWRSQLQPAFFIFLVYFRTFEGDDVMRISSIV